MPVLDRAAPVRLCVARPLGRDIDGAWWPRGGRIVNELPHLVAVLTPLLGHITSINVNWRSLQRPPDLNWLGWRYKRQHVMTVNGDDASANLLIVPSATRSALALMVLRRAAHLPIYPADRQKSAFLTAGSILLAAQTTMRRERPITPAGAKREWIGEGASQGMITLQGQPTRGRQAGRGGNGQQQAH